MTQKKKLPKKVWAVVLSATAFFALIVILATCSLFDSKAESPIPTNWSTIVKNSTWTFSNMNVNNRNQLIAALQDAKSITFSEDLQMTIEYSDEKGSSYFFNAGCIDLKQGSSSASLSVRMASSDGYITNQLTLKFSNQEKKQFDNNNYVLSIVVENLGSIYFFKN